MLNNNNTEARGDDTDDFGGDDDDMAMQDDRLDTMGVLAPPAARVGQTLAEYIAAKKHDGQIRGYVFQIRGQRLGILSRQWPLSLRPKG